MLIVHTFDHQVRPLLWTEDMSSCPHNYAVWITGEPRSVSSKHVVAHLMPCFSIAFPMLVDENSTSGCSSQVSFCELGSFFTPDLNSSAHRVSSSLTIECTQSPPPAHCLLHVPTALTFAHGSFIATTASSPAPTAPPSFLFHWSSRNSSTFTSGQASLLLSTPWIVVLAM